MLPDTKPVFSTKYINLRLVTPSRFSKARCKIRCVRRKRILTESDSEMEDVETPDQTKSRVRKTNMGNKWLVDLSIISFHFINVYRLQ